MEFQAIFLASKTPYYSVIAIAVVVIISYLFNLLSQKTNIPGVLMLIVLGAGIKIMLEAMHIRSDQYNDYLEILGIVGLIMIVLEAALDLELSKENRPIIWKSFMVALLSLVVSALLIAVLIMEFGIQNYSIALIYAIPLSIMSSAIIIPSVGGLSHEKKEFMVYESTFSDILGIMFFFFLTGFKESSSAGEIVGGIFLNITLTIIIAAVASYLLVFIFQRITSHIKLFLLIAVLLLLYATGKLLGLSSLVIILVFGLLLNNREVFFRGKLKEWLDHKKIEAIEHDFRIVTLETAFVVRTFFFVIFGMSIEFGTLKNPRVAMEAICIVGVLFLVRFLVLKLFMRKNIFPQVFIAPRGLITILLFFSISPHITQNHPFDSGVLLYCIIITAIVMTWSLIKHANGLHHVDEAYDQNLKDNAGGALKAERTQPQESHEGVETMEETTGETTEEATEETIGETTEEPTASAEATAPADLSLDVEDANAETAAGKNEKEAQEKPQEEESDVLPSQPEKEG